MSDRLTRIVTRTGDGGETGLADGSRVSKAAPRIAAIGAVDELNSVIGVVASISTDPLLISLLQAIQHDLFDLGGHLAMPAVPPPLESRLAWLEQAITSINEQLPPLKEFVLPGGCAAAAQAQLARAVCRRAERDLVALAAIETLDARVLPYTNRLSDLLFVLARKANRDVGVAEPVWRKRVDEG